MRPITASDLMNPEVLTASDDMSLAELAAFLLDNQITGAPVASRTGQLIGVVSVVDLARVIAEDPGDDQDQSGAQDQSGTIEMEMTDVRQLLVADVMTPSVFSVSEDSSVSEIASTMLDNHLHRIVVTRDTRPVGIISSSDLFGLLIDDNDGWGGD